ncbi:MAG: YncE family protein, partial [Microcoleus sp. PH2017_07_MST_O_A]|nr:YncE family protein [Microcoleus sp. PH2017_07_MST_O_A]
MNPANPFSPTYHQVTQTIPVGTAPSGLRQIALSSDGKKLFVTAPNGANSKIYAVNIDPKDRPISPGANPKKWNQLIGTVTADEGVEGLAATVDPLKMTFTNSGKDSKGFGVLDITNNDPVSFAATTRYTNLGLGSTFDYFDVNEGVSVTVLPDASYAFVVGR